MDNADTAGARARKLIRAAAWRKHLTEIDADSTEDFERWLASDAAHREAWRQVGAPWEMLDEKVNSPEMLALRRAALGHARAASYRRSRRAAWSKHKVRYAWAAGVMLVLAGALFVGLTMKPARYRTDLGERRVVSLADGSTLTLDSLSEVRVSYSDTARELELTQGQARFDVAPDVERPFSVRAANQKIVALGTAFNVDLLGNKVLVTLLEGRVAVVDRDTRKNIELKPGERLQAVDETTPIVSAVSVDAQSAWQKGQLIFDDEPLFDVAQRVSRYSERTVEVADPQAAQLHVSGVFNAGEVDRFVATMTEYLPVVAETGHGSRIRLRHR